METRKHEPLTGDNFLNSILNSLPQQICVMTGNGDIVWINEAWREFSRKNGGSPDKTDINCNYLSVCSCAADNGDAEGASAHQGILDVLEARRPVFHFEYPCHGPTTQRWFMMTIFS